MARSGHDLLLVAALLPTSAAPAPPEPSRSRRIARNGRCMPPKCPGTTPAGSRCGSPKALELRYFRIELLLLNSAFFILPSTLIFPCAPCVSSVWSRCDTGDMPVCPRC